MPDALNIRDKLLIALGKLAAQFRIALPGDMAPVKMRGNVRTLQIGSTPYKSGAGRYSASAFP
jgi:hypothetical protein